MTIIEQFIAIYKQSKTDYQVIQNEAERILKQLVNDAGILAIVTSRVKDPDRLKEKLLDRNPKAQYRSFDDIVADIPDFVGARIALYFPNDKDRIFTLLSHNFEIVKIKTFPNEQREYKGYDRRFSGYSATHYRVRFKHPPRSKLGNPIFEIQVASLLMHAWSEVEHDLAYKAMKGEVSFDEYESLDEINGLMIAGEISLQRLQRLYQTRIKSGEKAITDHYQLSAYLFEKVSAVTKKRNINLGDVETLYQLLLKKDRLTQKKLDNDLAKLDFYDDIPIAEQLSDYYANKSFTDTNRIIKNKARKNHSNSINTNDAKIGSFLRQWIALEKKLNENRRQSDSLIHSYDSARQFYSKEAMLSPVLWNKYKEVRRFRNNLVHGYAIPTSSEIQEYENIITTIMRELTEETETCSAVSKV